MITKDGAGREILELHIWIGIVYNPETGQQLTEWSSKKSRKEVEDWWIENKPFFVKPVDIRITMASVREMK